MSAAIILDDVIRRLARRYGKPRLEGKARILTFGSALTCSLNYSKLLRGEKYFFGLPSAIIDPAHPFPATKFGEFVLLICGSAENALVLPRAFMVDMMKGVTSRRVDVFVENGVYILQTTKHPKADVTEFLNALPVEQPTVEQQLNSASEAAEKPPRIHVRIQFGLIQLGRAEGCSVWVPVNDRNLAYQGNPFSALTVGKLPNLGFEENTRRIVQNIDVLWLTRNSIRKAFEIEATTSVYSGLLRLNDLVLSQPNVQIDLYVVASEGRRDKVCGQLMRPSFQQLLPKCEFVTFEKIEAQVERLETFPTDPGVRVSGLVRGERFQIPDHYLYPTGI